MALSKIVLYTMIGAIFIVLVIIIVLIIFLCKRRKKDPTEIKDPSMQLEILDDEESNEDDTSSILCGGRSRKKKSSTAPLPESLPEMPHYKPGTMLEGVYERISSADVDTKYDVSFLDTPDKTIVEDINTYVSIGRSNSFNPNKRERPVIRKSREEPNKVKHDESIKCIETGIVPLQTDDIKIRVQELTKTEPNTRVKQKKTSQKKGKGNASPNADLKTLELVKITPPVIKKDLNKIKLTDTHNLNTSGYGKPASVSGASVISSNDSEAASNLGTDSGYDDINSESSPTVKRIHANIEGSIISEKSNSSGSQLSPTLRNYIDVDVVPHSLLLQQRSNSIIERRNSSRPTDEHESSNENSMIETNDFTYTQVTIDMTPT